MNLASEIVFLAGSLICHQRPERSFFWAGHQFPVCARCTGLYLSALTGLLGWLAIKSATRWRRRPIDPRTARTLFVAAAVPTAISLASGALGVWDGSNITRALTALPLGAAAGVIVAAVATKDLR
jgi:uncharacterized membrane protein